MLRDRTVRRGQPRLAVRFHFPHGKGLSKWAANRLRKSGKGPRIVQLTEHAVGVTVKDDREWTEARIRDGQ